jgi:hypothetical protein
MHTTNPILSSFFSALVVSGVGVIQAQTPQQQKSSERDGRWMALVICEDVKTGSGIVKGYKLPVSVEIRDGNLIGKYDEPGAISTLALSGSVYAGGEVRIEAKGITGAPEYNLNKVGAGRPYGYTLTGTLGTTTGEAARNELRPCRAVFTKQ